MKENGEKSVTDCSMYELVDILNVPFPAYSEKDGTFSMPKDDVNSSKNERSCLKMEWDDRKLCFSRLMRKIGKMRQVKSGHLLLYVVPLQNVEKHGSLKYPVICRC